MSSLVDQYIDWLRVSFEEKEVQSWTEVVTPFLDRNNDHIQLYLKQQQDRVIITDDGTTFANLEFAGFSKTDKRADIIATVFRGFEIKWPNTGSVELECSSEEFPNKFHALIQTILSIDSFGYFTEQNVKSMFFEDVAAWLSRNEISYFANKEYEGKSGMKVNFSFSLPPQKSSNPAIIQLFNNPKHSFKPLLFEWIDTESQRGESNRFTIINDNIVEPPKKTLKAFEKYGVVPIKWSERDQLLEKLTG